MNDVQQRMTELKAKGWTLAAIADEIGVGTRAVEYWQQGGRYPGNAKMVLMGLDSLLERKRIPKKRRYAKDSRTRDARHPRHAPRSR